MPEFARWLAIRVALPVAAFLFGAVAAAQPFPAKPMRLIIPYPAGGSSDLIGRVVAQKMGELLGQQVIVDNRAGAGGRIGMEATAKAPPDGYTIGFGSLSPLSIAPSLYVSMPYDPVKSFAPVILVFHAPFLVVVHPSVPATTLRQLVDLDKASSGKLNFASVGTGTVLHFYGENFNAVTGSRLVHIPFKGAAPALVALLSGEVQVMFDQLASFQLANFQSGRLRAIAVAAATRLPQFPNLPTAAEAGFPGIEESVWFGFVAPAGTPRESVRTLNAAVQKALAAKEVVEVLVNQNALVLGGGSPEDFAATIRNDMAKWARIVKATGFRPE